MTETEQPWFKQIWLWAILTPLIIAIIVGFSMLYLSIVTSDGVIIDNPYKDGKGYVERTEEDDFARNHILQAGLYWQENKLKLTLSGSLTPLPESIDLLIAHPTSEAFDITVRLQHQGLGEYTGLLPEKVSGRRLLQLQPVNTEQDWRLHFEGTVPPISSRLELKPKQE